ncbi:MAG TPA: thylakoid-associated protein [Cyanothece sp. UBA12306]|nr:thylakoid-associated protein [Cyanothece sp. UBA12306]
MSIVSLISAHSYESSVLRRCLENLLEPLGGMGTFVKPGDRVLLKPNLLTASRPTKECITRAEIVYCVAQLVKEQGGQPFFGDSPAFGSALGVAKANGYLPLMEQLDIPIVEFQGQRYQIDSDQFNHLRLSKEAMEADVVINLPKVKSHLQLTLTLGVKNLFGCVPGKMKAWWHMEAGKDVNRFGTMLVETARAINPNLTIIDGIIGHEGNGPSGGEPRHLGILGAAQDVFALDRVMVDILGVDPQSVPTVAAQTRLGLASDLSEMQFPLVHPSELQVNDWRLPESLMPIDFGLPRVIRSTFKHFYIRFLQEPLKAYSGKV